MISPPRAATATPTCRCPPGVVTSVVCPTCLLGVAAKAPQMIGPYELDTPLGSGGCGLVYLAVERTSGRLVALKVAGDNGPEAEEVFREEIRNASKLAHPHIVRALTSGHAANGAAFLVMEFMEGGTLREAVDLGRIRDRREILVLVAKIARAVQHAHDRAILHCDVKPENILFDGSGEPQLADIGLGRRLEGLRNPRMEACGGTLGWMSPEQVRLLDAADDSRQPLTVSSDVFSLGVLFYWLLSGGLPFGQGPEFVHRVQHDDAPDPLRLTGWSSGLDWECAAICRRALAKKPTDRYASAAALAQDLERALRGESLSIERTMAPRRVAKWMRRHTALTALMLLSVTIACFLAIVITTVFGELQRVLLDHDVIAVRHQAHEVSSELRKVADGVTALARDPDVHALVTHSDLWTPPPALSRYLTPDIDNILVFTPEGDLKARWPGAPKASIPANYAFRDYVRGAGELARRSLRQPYVARVIRGTIDDRVTLEISAPMYGPAGDFVGIVTVGHHTRSTFGDLQMRCFRSGCITALLAPRDRDEAGAALPEGLIILSAPNLRRGTDVYVDPALSRAACHSTRCAPAPYDQLDIVTESEPMIVEFRDPLSQLPVTGALMPIARTGLMVVVASPSGEARALLQRIVLDPGRYFGLAFILGLGFVGTLWLTLHRPPPLRS